MNELMIFILCLVVAIICGISMRNIALRREANHQLWFFVGLILGPLALIFIPLIKSKKSPS